MMAPSEKSGASEVPAPVPAPPGTSALEMHPFISSGNSLSLSSRPTTSLLSQLILNRDANVFIHSLHKTNN